MHGMRQSKLFVSAITFALLLAMVVGCAGTEATPTPTPTPTATPEPVANGAVTETLITEIDFSSWIPESLTVSPDSQHMAYVAVVGDKQLLVVDGIEAVSYTHLTLPTILLV